jgi:hypothetical protein
MVEAEFKYKSKPNDDTSKKLHIELTCVQSTIMVSLRVAIDHNPTFLIMMNKFSAIGIKIYII